jgi:hypothetical protein
MRTKGPSTTRWPNSVLVSPVLPRRHHGPVETLKNLEAGFTEGLLVRILLGRILLGRIHSQDLQEEVVSTTAGEGLKICLQRSL